MNDWTSTIPGIAGPIVVEALRVGEIDDDTEWTSGRIGMSAGKDRLAFAGILPVPSTWKEALKVPYSYDAKTGKTKGVSTCGLVAVGIMARAGIPLPWMTDAYYHWTDPLHGATRYTGLDVVSCLSQLSLSTKSRRPAGVYPQPGDVCCIGSGLRTHVLTVVSVDGHNVWSIDGGQVDGNHGYLQCIKLVKRDWRGLRVVWVIDTAKLRAAIP